MGALPTRLLKRTPMASDATDARRADRRQEILAAAAAQFREKGYAGTSIQDIADSLGLLKGSLYHYISGKEDLLFEVIHKLHRDYLAEIESIRSAEGDALTRLREFVRRQVIYNTTNPDRAAISSRELQHRPPERQEEIVAVRRETDDYLRGLIAEAQADGTVAADLDPKLAAMAFFGMMNWLYQWYRPGGQRTPEEIGEQFARMAVQSLQPTT